MLYRTRISVIVLACLMAATITTAKVPSTPKFTIKSLDGNTHSSKLLRGKAMFITFFARGCEPCKKEAPFLNDLQKKYPDTLQILAIGWREKKSSELAALAKEWSIEYPVCLDPEGDAAIAFGVKYLPYGVLIDHRSAVITKYEGMTGKKQKDLVKRLSSMQPEIIKYQKEGPSFHVQSFEETSDDAAGEGKVWEDKIRKWLVEMGIKTVFSSTNADYVISGNVSKISNIIGVEIVINFRSSIDVSVSGVVKSGNDTEIRESFLKSLAGLPYVIRN